jgi:hypothetical protein
VILATRRKTRVSGVIGWSYRCLELIRRSQMTNGLADLVEKFGVVAAEFFG